MFQMQTSENEVVSDIPTLDKAVDLALNRLARGETVAIADEESGVFTDLFRVGPKTIALQPETHFLDELNYTPRQGIRLAISQVAAIRRILQSRGFTTTSKR